MVYNFLSLLRQKEEPLWEGGSFALNKVGNEIASILTFASQKYYFTVAW